MMDNVRQDIFFTLVAIALDIIFASTLTREIGRQKRAVLAVLVLLVFASMTFRLFRIIHLYTE